MFHHVTQFATTVTRVRAPQTLSSMKFATLPTRWPLLRCIYFTVSLNSGLEIPIIATLGRT